MRWLDHLSLRLPLQFFFFSIHCCPVNVFLVFKVIVIVVIVGIFGKLSGVWNVGVVKGGVVELRGCVVKTFKVIRYKKFFSVWLDQIVEIGLRFFIALWEEVVRCCGVVSLLKTMFFLVFLCADVGEVVLKVLFWDVVSVLFVDVLGLRRLQQHNWLVVPAFVKVLGALRGLEGLQHLLETHPGPGLLLWERLLLVFFHPVLILLNIFPWVVIGLSINVLHDLIRDKGLPKLVRLGHSL